MNYENYQVEDFIKDEFFVSWVIESDAEASLFWKKWLQSHPEKRTEIEHARELIKSIRYKHTSELTDTEYSQMFEKLLRKNEKGMQVRQLRLRSYFYGIAASVLLLIVSYFGYYRAEQHVDEVKVANLTVFTEYGQRKTIQLPDGTIVKLNTGSIIEYPEIFERDQRKVKLTGEAYFDVYNSTDWPFVIQSNELITEVLGTSFNVSAYPEDSTVSVSVVSGLVKISNDEGDVELLSPTDMGIFSKYDKSLNKSSYDPEVLSWYHGILIFKNQWQRLIFEY